MNFSFMLIILSELLIHKKLIKLVKEGCSKLIALFFKILNMILINGAKFFNFDLIRAYVRTLINNNQNINH